MIKIVVRDSSEGEARGDQHATVYPERSKFLERTVRLRATASIIAHKRLDHTWRILRDNGGTS